MTHHRKRHKARRRRRQPEMDHMKVTLIFKNAPTKTYQVVVIAAHADGHLKLVCVGKRVEEFPLADILSMKMLPPREPSRDQVTALDAYEAG